ncbi:DEAD/DEAH box helicase [Myxococcota bacterium]|nr:DEAD/DEAH box helicase [Myxococcota bacterium]
MIQASESIMVSAQSPKMIPELLARAFQKKGFAELTPVQEAVLRCTAENEGSERLRDFRISSQTGSGKTVAFGFALAPVLLSASVIESTQRATRALVIVPTRELVTQVCNELKWLYADVKSVQITGLMGGASMLRERGNLSRKPTLVVATPGRLLDHIRNNALTCKDISHVVLDEADRLLDMGFREELDEILAALPAERTSHMASATFPANVRKLAERFQRKPLKIEGPGSQDAHPDIVHIAHVVRPKEIYSALVNLLLMNPGSRSLVFVRRRIDASEIAEKLASDGFAAMPLSGELPQAQRNRTLSAFRNGSLEILVATDVAARGIDVPDIANVIHLDTPFDPETYVHRSGRTGRAGSQGRSLMIIPSSQERRMRNLLSTAGVTAAWLPPPGPKQVRKAARKRQRSLLWSRLEKAEELSESQLEYADSLLKSHPPQNVVAALLEMATPPSPCEPQEIGAPTKERNARTQKRASDYVTFSISYGTRRGATKARVLSQICRRGEISAEVIGAIQLQTGRSLFQIARGAATAFEKKAGRPDKRDPGIHIEPVTAEINERRRRPAREKSSRSPRGKANSANSERHKRRKPKTSS